MTHIKILSVLQVVGHPRHSIRIAMLQEAGFEVDVIAFERPYHSGRMPSCPVESLGKISHGHYFKRLLKFPSVFFQLRRAIKQHELIYASGFDMILLTLLSGVWLRKPVVMEMGDIRGVQTAPGIKGRILRMIERRLAQSCRLIVVTAPSFYDVYYRQWLKTTTPGLVIENKLENTFVEEIKQEGVASPAGRPFVDRPFRIGHFGVLRERWSWDVLKTLATRLPGNVEIVIAGLPLEPILEIPEWIARQPNIEYLGEYKSPDDLAALYHSVDMVWACYPPIQPDGWNFRWARPNRFYQSCLFQKPIFTRAGCQDAVDVARYDIGMVISAEKAEDAAEAMESVSAEDLQRWTENMAQLPANIYSYADEVDELRKKIESFVGDRN